MNRWRRYAASGSLGSLCMYGGYEAARTSQYFGEDVMAAVLITMGILLVGTPSFFKDPK